MFDNTVLTNQMLRLIAERRHAMERDVAATRLRREIRRQRRRR